MPAISRNLKENIKDTLIFGGLLILGIGACIFLFHRLYLADVSTSWPVVQGRILENRMKCTTSDSKTHCKRIIRYEYHLERIRYHNDRVRWLGWDDEVTGREVEVHYNPENPQQSVLQTGIIFSAILQLVLGCFLAITFGIVMPIICLRSIWVSKDWRKK